MFRASGFVLASLSSLALLGSSALADGARSKITIYGNGRASAPPEFVTVHVTVTSICYDSSVAAKNANAVLANKVLKSLQSYATDPQDKVTASGGQNVRETTMVQDGNTWKTLCTLKWKSTNNLTIQMKKIDDLPFLQDKILSAVDQASVVDPNQVAQTYADMASPAFAVYPATKASLQKQADVAAYNDAKSQRDAFAGTCGFTDMHLDSIQPPQQYIWAARAQGAAMPAPADNTVTPILPDEISVDASWTFQWSFVPGANCFAAP